MRILLWVLLLYPAMLCQAEAFSPPLPLFAANTCLAALAAISGLWFSGRVAIPLAAGCGLVVDLLAADHVGATMLAAVMMIFALQIIAAGERPPLVMTIVYLFAVSFMIRLAAALLQQAMVGDPATGIIPEAAYGAAFWSGVFVLTCVLRRLGIAYLRLGRFAPRKTVEWTPHA